MLRIRVGHRSELHRGAVLSCRLPRDEQGRSLEALVVLDEWGQPHGYLNLCRHLPIPLDGGSKRYLDDEGTSLMCGTHGALYRLRDGYCFEGPCKGRSLLRCPLEEDEDGTLWVRPPVEPGRLISD